MAQGLQEMSPSYHNSQVYAPRADVTAEDDLHENTPVEDYDINSILPVPETPLRTDRVALEPLIVGFFSSLDYPVFDPPQPLLHAESLFNALSTAPKDSDPDVWFYPFPKGRPHGKRISATTFTFLAEGYSRDKIRNVGLYGEAKTPAQCP